MELSNSRESIPSRDIRVFGIKEVDLFCTNQLYSKRIFNVQEHVLQLSRHYKFRDNHIVVIDGFGKLVEERRPDISLQEYSRLSNEKFFVYEVFDYLKTRKKIEVVNILIYYPQSKLCFVYKGRNYYHIICYLGYFDKILRDIDCLRCLR